MKIYMLESTDGYQYFLPDQEDVVSPKGNGQPLGSDWKVPPFYILKPNLKRGNFVYWFAKETLLITDQKATEELRDLFEMSGELFPFNYKGELFTLLNPLNTYAVLDEEHTIWRLHFKTGEKTEVIEKYVFKLHRIPEVPIFRIPENRVALFTVEGMKDPEDEFKFRVEKAGLTGINFVEVWSD